MSTVSIGDTNVGYKVIAVKKGQGGLSIVLAQRADDDYVVWSFDGTSFKNGIYERDQSEARAIYKSRTNY